MRPEALLFDLDGTLLDSEILWESAQRRTMARFGQTWTADDQAHSIGGPLERVSEHIAVRTGADAEQIAGIIVDEIEREVAARSAAWMPGAREFISAAHEAGIPTAIVSNSWRVLLDLLVRNIDIPVTVTVSSTEAEEPKPHPAPYLLACRLLDVDPMASVAVEDSPTGVASGLAAGCFVLAVGSAVGHLRNPNLRHVPSLADVNPFSIRGDSSQNP